ncbi:MAG: outer membrane protein OmpA-like peptidoglycan-associated protein [Marinoscillum sp.]|jgi:outer membrane protein OmpA-like peptidoglycan-associated protein
MRKFNFALAFIASAFIFSGCALSKMVKLAANQDLQVTPNPLEIHGGAVPVTMAAVLPPKMLPTGKVYTINTIYQYGDQEVAVGSIEFKASDFPSSSSSTSRKSADFTFPYQDGMSPGTLYVEGVASDPKSGKSAKSPRMAVAQGLISTSSFTKPVALTTYADHGYSDKEELVPTNVNFFFDQGVSTLNPSLSMEGASNRSKSNDLSAFIAAKNVTKTVTITGTHSPEGTETINKGLSEARAKAIESFYRNQMKRYDYKGMADSIKFILKPVVEDWSALKMALNSYNDITGEDKSKMMSIVNGVGSFEEKEKSLQKVASYKKVLENVYPGLRTAKTEILTIKPKKSNAEIAVLSKKIVSGDAKLDTLTNAELLFAATLTPALGEKAAIYKAASKSGAWEAHNNLGAAYIDQAKKAQGAEKTKLIEDAITQLEIAKNKNKSAMISANLAAAYVLQSDNMKATDAVTMAEDASPANTTAGNISGMKGALQMMKADYSAATTSFASAAKSDVVTFDSGLALLLSGNNAEAKDVLSGVVKSEMYGAEANYLIAIASARSNQSADVISSLKAAFEKDPSLKDKALNDLEFNKYADAVATAVK